MTRRVLLLLSLLTLIVSFPISAQSECPMQPRLIVGRPAKVGFTDGSPLNVRAEPALDAEKTGQIPEGSTFGVHDGPRCRDGIQWWHILTSDLDGWIAEGVDNVYLVEPATAATPSTTSLPAEPVNFDWEFFSGGFGDYDPTRMQLPAVYAGDLPALPITETNIRYLADANLTYEQASMLMQNGFVVVPGTAERFINVYDYEGGWKSIENEMYERPLFITTDVVLNALHMTFEQLLIELEKAKLTANIYLSTDNALRVAVQQYQDSTGTSLEEPARDALVYITVARLLMPRPESIQLGQNDDGFMTVAFGGDPLELVPQDVRDEAQAIADKITAAEGQEKLSFFENYTEDFGAYRVRGHYTESQDLSNYFRVMSWVGRVTFRADDATETAAALLVMRAYALAPASLFALSGINEAITLLVGPADDLTLFDYLPLAQETFGEALDLAALGDATQLAAFQEQLKTLPKPRINSMILPADTPAEALAGAGQGFRLMGQRFTYDGYILGQLFAPHVEQRILPSALDVPAALGSDAALELLNATGVQDLAEYPAQMEKMRQAMGAVTTDEWLESTSSGWLWMLEPLWERDNPESYPPLMLSDAWRRRELQTGLASYTELKHGTMLYAKEPTGLGGGGPPLLAHGYVEPNPLLFSRLSILSAMTYHRLNQSLLLDPTDPAHAQLLVVAGSMRQLAFQSAEFAEAARRELAGEPLDSRMYFDIQEFGGYLYSLEYNLYTQQRQNQEPLPPAAIVTTIANNGTFQLVLHEGTGLIDYIYVVIPGPAGLQVARGGVYSYYEFPTENGVRLTDEEWRTQVLSGETPARPAWTEAFLQP